jgi:hypothetical protein
LYATVDFCEHQNPKAEEYDSGLHLQKRFKEKVHSAQNGEHLRSMKLEAYWTKSNQPKQKNNKYYQSGPTMLCAGLEKLVV